MILKYEKRETPEAQVVSQMDKFDMYLQAHEYESGAADLRNRRAREII